MTNIPTRMKPASTQRFSNRVANYVKYRPGYPPEVLNLLREKCGLTPQSIIADVGAGTGIFTQLLVRQGYKVYAVEPNHAMRKAAMAALITYPNFYAVNGTAEATTLRSQSVDLIVCAQAFHWFNPKETALEFKRILANHSKQVALIWNNRLTDADDFAIAYEQLLVQKATDYSEVNHQHLKGADFASFYRHGQYEVYKFDNEQWFDAEGLAGRAFSSSYAPAPDTPAGQEFAQLLLGLFNQHQQNGRVRFSYQTEVYLGGV